MKIEDAVFRYCHNLIVTTTGIGGVDNYSARGNKKTEKTIPELGRDMQSTGRSEESD